MNKSLKKGYSVLELIIYMALLALFMLLVVNTILVMSGSYRKLSLSRTIANSAATSMERITREIRQATDVDVAQSILNAENGKLRLLTTNDDGYAQTVSFALNDGAINVYENDLLVGPLTKSFASTTALIFRVYSNLRSKAVSVEMTIQAQKGTEIKTETFNTTIVLRNSI